MWSDTYSVAFVRQKYVPLWSRPHSGTRIDMRSLLHADWWIGLKEQPDQREEQPWNQKTSDLGSRSERLRLEASLFDKKKNRTPDHQELRRCHLYLKLQKQQL